MHIASIATALPKHYYPQEVLVEAFRAHWGGKLDRFRVLEHLHAATQVDGRFLALPIDRYPFATFGEANRAWIEGALELGQDCVSRAIEQAGVQPDQIGAFFFSSITGISSPSIEGLLINRLSLNRRTKRVPIFGLGCSAGAAGISRAADYVRAFPKQAALFLSVELCSLTIQPDDLSPANLISSGLFGDGAGAVVVAGAECPVRSGPAIVDTRSMIYPESEYIMGWDISEKGFTIVLSRDTPEIVRQHIGRDIEEFLGDHGLRKEDVGSWALHTGGPKILEATEQALALPEGALEVSWRCLRKTGNLSSASVLFVLEQVINEQKPNPDTWGVLAAMGPGFASEIALLRW